jgi:hypothetical protein
MQIGFIIILVAVLSLAFVPLALTQRRGLAVRTAYVLVGMFLAFSFGLLFDSMEFGRVNDGRHTIAVPPPGLEVESATRWAVHAFGGCLAFLAAGELLRLILKRTAGTEIIAPTLLFLAGVLLVEPQWGAGAALAVGLAAVAVVAVWGRLPAAPATEVQPAEPPALPVNPT